MNIAELKRGDLLCVFNRHKKYPEKYLTEVKNNGDTSVVLTPKKNLLRLSGREWHFNKQTGITTLLVWNDKQDGEWYIEQPSNELFYDCKRYNAAKECEELMRKARLDNWSLERIAKLRELVIHNTPLQFEELFRKHRERALYRDTFDPGHLTGSCLVTNYQLDKVLLMFHKKHKGWMQFGGHCDGESPYKAAVREMKEEFGGEIEVQRPVFQLDVHSVDAYGEEPAHYHFDVNYLAFYDDQVEFPASPEGIEFKWHTLDEVLEINKSVAMRKMVESLRYMKCWNDTNGKK